MAQNFMTQKGRAAGSLLCPHTYTADFTEVTTLLRMLQQPGAHQHPEGTESETLCCQSIAGQDESNVQPRPARAHTGREGHTPFKGLQLPRSRFYPNPSQLGKGSSTPPRAAHPGTPSAKALPGSGAGCWGWQLGRGTRSGRAI